MPVPGVRYARVNAGGTRAGVLRDYHALHHVVKRAICTVLVHGSRGPFNGPRTGDHGGLLPWPSPRILRALLARFGALLGLCAGCAMRGRAWAGLRCLFSLYECTVLDGHTVHEGMSWRMS